MFKNKINQLLEQEMDRKDFLKHVGIAVIALSGATTVLRALTISDKKSHGSTSTPHATLGYGASVYGGKKTN